MLDKKDKDQLPKSRSHPVRRIPVTKDALYWAQSMTERERRLLELLLYFTEVRSDYAADLIYRAHATDPKRYNVRNSVYRRSVKKLRDGGLIEAVGILQPVGKLHHYYTLGELGIKVLALAHPDLQGRMVKWLEARRKRVLAAGDPQALHTLSTQMVLSAMVKENPYPDWFRFWWRSLEERMETRGSTRQGGQRSERPTADIWRVAREPGEPEWYSEVDTGTESGPKLRKKFTGYKGYSEKRYATWRRGQGGFPGEHILFFMVPTEPGGKIHSTRLKTVEAALEPTLGRLLDSAKASRPIVEVWFGEAEPMAKHVGGYVLGPRTYGGGEYSGAVGSGGGAEAVLARALLGDALAFGLAEDAALRLLRPEEIKLGAAYVPAAVIQAPGGREIAVEDGRFRFAGPRVVKGLAQGWATDAAGRQVLVLCGDRERGRYPESGGLLLVYTEREYQYGSEKILAALFKVKGE